MNKDAIIELSKDTYDKVKELADKKNISIDQMINIILEEELRGK